MDLVAAQGMAIFIFGKLQQFVNVKLEWSLQCYIGVALAQAISIRRHAGHLLQLCGPPLIATAKADCLPTQLADMSCCYAYGMFALVRKVCANE